MPRTKKLNVVVRFTDTDLVINDLGLGHSPRYELYDTAEKKVVKKSNDPLVFDSYAEKIWKESEEE